MKKGPGTKTSAGRIAPATENKKTVTFKIRERGGGLGLHVAGPER